MNAQRHTCSCSPFVWCNIKHTHTGQRLTVPDIPSAHQVCLERDGREMYSSWSLWAKASGYLCGTKALKRNLTCHRKCKHLALRAIWSSFQLRLGIRPLAVSFSFPLNLSHFLHAQFFCFLLSSYVSVLHSLFCRLYLCLFAGATSMPRQLACLVADPQSAFPHIASVCHTWHSLSFLSLVNVILASAVLSRQQHQQPFTLWLLHYQQY